MEQSLPLPMRRSAEQHSLQEFVSSELILSVTSFDSPDIQRFFKNRRLFNTVSKIDFSHRIVVDDFLKYSKALLSMFQYVEQHFPAYEAAHLQVTLTEIASIVLRTHRLIYLDNFLPLWRLKTSGVSFDEIHDLIRRERLKGDNFFAFSILVAEFKYNVEEALNLLERKIVSCGEVEIFPFLLNKQFTLENFLRLTPQDRSRWVLLMQEERAQLQAVWPFAKQKKSFVLPLVLQVLLDPKAANKLVLKIAEDEVDVFRPLAYVLISKYHDLGSARQWFVGDDACIQTIFEQVLKCVRQQASLALSIKIRELLECALVLRVLCDPNADSVLRKQGTTTILPRKILAMAKLAEADPYLQGPQFLIVANEWIAGIRKEYTLNLLPAWTGCLSSVKRFLGCFSEGLQRFETLRDDLLNIDCAFDLGQIALTRQAARSSATTLSLRSDTEPEEVLDDLACVFPKANPGRYSSTNDELTDYLSSMAVG